MRWAINEIVSPALRRGGTAFGAYLVGVGVHADQATQIAAGAVALAGVLVDLLLSYRARN